MKKITISFLLLLVAMGGFAQSTSRALWASVCAKPQSGDVTTSSELKGHYGKMLLSWRALPEDGYQMKYHIYQRATATVDGPLSRVTPAAGVSKATCYQTSSLPTQARTYYLLRGDFFGEGNAPSAVSDEEQKLALRTQALDSLEIGEQVYKTKVPYLTIPLQPTSDVCAESDIVYQANDCSVGDLDGDGQMEVVVKRLLTVLDGQGNVVSDGTGAGSSDRRARHCVVWDAYKLDGTLLWRIKSGPNIILGNSSNFAVADLDGDGRCEFVTKTGEGTVFGDGAEIGDTDGDGRTDYRDNWVTHYTGPSDKGRGGPEFFSVCDGATGRELARADFISATDRGSTWKAQSESWGDNYWKRANSLRLGAASFLGDGTMQIFLGRGVYARTVVEGWQYADGQLTRLWHFDSSNSGGRDTNKDGKANSAYAGQGNHSFNVADLDGDGRDEVMYGSCAFDDDGTGLWSTGLGHGDANHVGKFLPERDGLQVYHCLESGRTQVALHDARDGAIIWKKEGSSDNDMGRCMVADINPSSPGCEFWMYGNEVYSATGQDLGYKTASCNMGIWFDGTLNRQLIDGDKIDGTPGRVFTIYRFNAGYNNGTKKNPGWVGDMLGDWREEFIAADQSKTQDIKIFSTWYPTQHKFPWLMTDHTYLLSAINENVGYNQPTNLGYYLGSDLKTDEEAWQAASATAGISPSPIARPSTPHFYNLHGQRLSQPPLRGIYIHNGRKYLAK